MDKVERAIQSIELCLLESKNPKCDCRKTVKDLLADERHKVLEELRGKLKDKDTGVSANLWNEQFIAYRKSDIDQIIKQMMDSYQD